MSTGGIRGLQEAQRWNARAIANMKPGGQFGRDLQTIISQVERYEVTIAHVDTGAMKNSIRMELKALEARTYIDPTARNPRTRAVVARYAEIEDNRGGSHAFAQRTVHEAVPGIVGRTMAYSREHYE